MRLAALAVLTAALMLCGPRAAAQQYAGICAMIPDDAAVVVLAGDQSAALAALGAYLDAAAPQSARLPEGTGVRVPVLTVVADLRDAVRQLSTSAREPGIAPGPAALAVILWGEADWGVIVVRGADEGAWREAGGRRVRESPLGTAERAGGAQPYSFAFQNGYMITSSSDAVIEAWERARLRPLSPARAAGLEQALAEGAPLAINISGAAAERARGRARRTFVESLAAGAGASIRNACGPSGPTPLGDAILAKLFSDYLAYIGEVYASAAPSAGAFALSARVELKSAGLYALIAAEQRGSAADVETLLSARAPAAVAMSLDGVVLRAYLKEFVGPLVAGMSGPGNRGTGSSAALRRIVDDLVSGVGLGNAAFVWLAHSDNTACCPVLVARAPDADRAVGAIAGAVAAFYGDALTAAHAKEQGFILGTPRIDRAADGRQSATVSVPFSMSSINPLKAAWAREVLGTEMVFRAAAVGQGERRLVVAGAFRTPAAMESFMSSLAPAGLDPHAPGGRPVQPGCRRVFSAYADLPQFLAAHYRGTAALSGKSARPPVPASRNVCGLAAVMEREGVRVTMEVPAEQIRGGFAAVSSVAAAIAAASQGGPGTPAATGNKPGHSSLEQKECEEDSRPRRPWGAR